MMIAETTPFATAIIVGVVTSGSLTALFNWWFNRQKTAAETEKTSAETIRIIQETYGDFIEDLNTQAQINIDNHNRQMKSLLEEIKALKLQTDRIPILEEEVKELTVGIKLLTDQLQEHNITPIYSRNNGHGL